MKSAFRLIVAAITIGFLVADAAPTPQPIASAAAIAAASPRRPRGIYAVVDINDYIAQQQKANASITASGLHAFFNGFYSMLLNNPALSGLALRVGWSRLNPNPASSAQSFDWSYLEDAFSAVGVWNGQNPTKAPKTIQVLVFPGFFTPQWVLDQIPSCDGLFQSPPQTPPVNCGKVTFTGFKEGRDGLTVLPLPWNAVYKGAFKTFLMAFAAHYEANPAFVSINVAGTTAASTEIIEPTNSRTPPQTQFGGILADDMWLRLLAFACPGKSSYQKTDQAFIDEWNAAIDMFGEVFSGITLVATHGSGLPNFSNTGFTIPSAFKDQCRVLSMDCAAEATIFAHFVDPSVGGVNAKAVQGSGLKGVTRPVSNIMKWLSQSTAHSTSPSAQIMAGEQFSTSFSGFPVEMGCTSNFPPDANNKSAVCKIPSTCTEAKCIPVACIPQACLASGVTQATLASYKQFGDIPARDLIPPEQALYNILKSYFDGTPAASSFGGTPGTVRQNYIQIHAADFEYVASHANTPAQVVQTGGVSVSVTTQDLLNLASQKLLEIGLPNLAP